MEYPGPSSTREAISEGAAEVKAKLREDLSRWTKTRRLVSLKPEIACLECDGAGRILCAPCQGSGLSRLVMEDGTQEPCPKCGGSGSITCVVCTGRGMVTNAYRKPVLWLLVIGGVAWALILFQLWGRDVLPEQRARVLQRGEHGRAVTAAGGSAARPGPVQQPPPASAGTAPYQGGYTGAPMGQGAQGVQPGLHGNAIQPGYGLLAQPGQPQGGVSQPYGGGQSLAGPR